MKTLIITDVRVYKYNNKYYIAEAFYRILERYSKKFVELSVLTRVVDTLEIPSGYKNTTNLSSSFINVGSIQKTIFTRNQNVIDSIKNSDFVILRLPSLVSIFLFKYVKKFKKKYMCEIMGCAWDALWNHSFVGKMIAPYAFFKMKKIVYNSNYALYVTNNFLQKRYPCNKKLNIGISNVNIEKIHKHKDYDKINKKNITLITAAAVDVKYKGQQYVIKAIKELKKDNIIVNYYLAGGGSSKYLKKVAEKNKVSNQVHFLGRLAHDDLIKIFEGMDFYIQPSLQEGLPRSVIEAMSCGCVCLGANTAGIPELLDKDQIFKRRNTKSIVETLKLNLTKNLNEISKKNIKESELYLAEKLNKKRYIFYDMINNDINNK